MTVAINPAKVRLADMKLEIAVIPVSDVDRAKQFYAQSRLAARRRLRHRRRLPRHPVHAARLGASVIFGKNVTPAAPGSAQGLYLVVSDIEAARKELLARGVAVSEVFHHEGDTSHRLGRAVPVRAASASAARIPSAAPTARSPRSAIRMATAGCCRRSPRGRPDAWTANQTTFASVADLAARCAARRPRTASTRSGSAGRDANWPDWYAEYLVAEQAGKPLPQ